jgi:hypothetical protein
VANQDYSHSIPGYDHWKLSNGEARAGNFVDDFEPDDDIELPLTCQECGKEYWYGDHGATAGYCPHCNGRERRVSGMRDRRAVVETAAKRMALWVGVVAVAMFILGVSVGYYEAAREAAGLILRAK